MADKLPENCIEDILDAMEMAMGVKTTDIDMDGGKISYEQQEPDTEKLRELYTNPLYRPLIDKFFEVGNVDKTKFGLPA